MTINVNTLIGMRIEFDAAKRAKTLAERGLDFALCAPVFLGVNVTIPDTRAHYGEQRFFTVGLQGGRAVVVVWTPRRRGSPHHFNEVCQ